MWGATGLLWLAGVGTDREVQCGVFPQNPRHWGPAGSTLGGICVPSTCQRGPQASPHCRVKESEEARGGGTLGNCRPSPTVLPGGKVRP